MKAIFKFFLKNYKYKSQIDYDKSKILLIIMLVGGTLTTLLSVYYVVSGTFNFLVAILPVIVLAIIVLLLIQRGKVILAGNIVTLFLTLLISFDTLFNLTNDPVYSFFMSEFYTNLFIVIFSAMFAIRFIFIINSIIVLITSLFIFIIKKPDLPTNIASYADTSFPVYMITLVLIFLITYFFTKFINTSVKLLSENNKKMETHNLHMKQVAKRIKISAMQLSHASNQQSLISQQITQSTNEQASTTEEISTTMEQMLAMINSNTKDAENTSEITTNSAKSMEQSKKMIIQTLESVYEINEKIKIISEIADKTDILSINASIEAARAGESGKGFTVVASEIRKLADKTLLASEEIEQLSMYNQNVSQTTSKQLDKVIPKILKSAKLVSNIVSASKEQQTGVLAINNSIIQLTSTTNENMATAEELSASAEELSTHAQQLNEIISNFNIK